MRPSQRSHQAHSAVRARLDLMQGSNHARLPTPAPGRFPRRPYPPRPRPEPPARRQTAAWASGRRAKPAGVNEPGLREPAEGKRRHAQVGRDLRRGPPLALLCRAQPLLPLPAEPGSHIQVSTKTASHRNQRRAPRLIGETRGGKHEALAVRSAPAKAPPGVAARN
jgi:hypothetical protein